MLTMNAGNTNALNAKLRTPLARVTSKAARATFGDNLRGGTLPEVDIDAEDIGRVVRRAGGGANFALMRVRWTTGGIEWEYWAGDPSSVSATTGLTSWITGYEQQSIAIWSNSFLGGTTDTVDAIVVKEDRAHYQVCRKTWHTNHFEVEYDDRDLPIEGEEGCWWATARDTNVGQTGYATHRLWAAHITPLEIRIWRTSNPFDASPTWVELPFRIGVRLNEDRFTTAPGAEGFGWRAANAFDVVRVENSYTVLLTQDHGAGRSLMIPVGAVVGDPFYPIPLDFVDEYENVTLTRFAESPTGGYVVTGSISRSDEWREKEGVGRALAYRLDVLLRSRDGLVWALQEDAQIPPGDATDALVPEWGQFVGNTVTRDQFYLSRRSIRKASGAVTTESYPYSVELNRGGESMPSGRMEVDSEGAAPSEYESAEIAFGYDSLSNLMTVAEVRIDRIEETEAEGDIRNRLWFRDLLGQKLADWAASVVVELPGHQTTYADFLSPDEALVTKGEPVAAVMEVLVLHNQRWLGGDDWDPNAAVEAGDVVRIWVPHDNMPDERGPLVMGQELRLRGGSDDRDQWHRWRVGWYEGRDELGIIYHCDVLATPGGAADAVEDNTYWGSDEIFLGRLFASDEVMVATPRRLFGQMCEARFRFSPYDWRWGESITFQIHRVDGGNYFYLTLSKEDGGSGDTDLKCAFGEVVEDRASERDSGILATTMDPLDGEWFVRWRYQQGRVSVWASETKGDYDSALVEFALHEAGVAVGGEGGVGVSGLLSPITHATTLDFYQENTWTVTAFHANGEIDIKFALDEPMDGWEEEGWVRINGHVRKYLSKGTQAKDGSRDVNEYMGGGWWKIYDFDDNPTHLLGMVAKLQNVDMDTDFILGWNGILAEVMETGVDGGKGTVRLGQDMPYIQAIGVLTALHHITFYPWIEIEDGGELGPMVAGPIELTTDPEGRTAQPVIDVVEVYDIEPDYSLAEAVRRVADMAGATLMPDVIPESAWGSWTVDSGASVTYTTANATTYTNLGQPIGGSASLFLPGTKTALSQMTVTSGVVRVWATLGAFALWWKTADGLGWDLRFTTTGIDLYAYDTGGSAALVTSFAFSETGSGSVSARIKVSFKGPYVAVWVDGQYAGTFRDMRWNGTPKQIGGRAYSATQAEARLEVFEAYEQLPPSLIEMGERGLAAVQRMIGRKKLALLYQSPLPIRFGTLRPRGDLGELLGVEYRRTTEWDSATPVTAVLVRGNGASAERYSDDEGWGWKYRVIDNPDITTRDAAEREALALLVESQEAAYTLVLDRDADLRVQNTDIAEVDGEDMIVTSSQYRFTSGEDEVLLHATLGLRRYRG